MNNQQAYKIISALQERVPEIRDDYTSILIALEMASNALLGQPIDQPEETLETLVSMLDDNDFEFAADGAIAIALAIVALSKIVSTSPKKVGVVLYLHSGGLFEALRIFATSEQAKAAYIKFWAEEGFTDQAAIREELESRLDNDGDTAEWWEEKVETDADAPVVQPNVEFVYMYRDGANYKTCSNHDAIFANPDGMDVEEAWKAMRAAAESSEFFIAHQVGLRELFHDDDGDDDAHCYHEMVSLGSTDVRPTTTLTLRQFVEQFSSTRWEPFDRANTQTATVQLRCECGWSGTATAYAGGPGFGYVCPECESTASVSVEIHWLRCDAPNLSCGWEGASSEVGQKRDEWKCPKCGGKKLCDLGVLSNDVLKHAHMRRDTFYATQTWVPVVEQLSTAIVENDAHRIIVHAALAAGHRLPIRVISEYPEVIRALRETNRLSGQGWDIILSDPDCLSLCEQMQELWECGVYTDHPETCPMTPSDFLAWFEAEANLEDELAAEPDRVIAVEERQHAKDGAETLRTFARRLRDTGVTPARLPWERG